MAEIRVRIGTDATQIKRKQKLEFIFPSFIDSGFLAYQAFLRLKKSCYKARQRGRRPRECDAFRTEFHRCILQLINRSWYETFFTSKLTKRFTSF